MAEQPNEVLITRLQAAREALFCEQVLAKSASNPLLATLGQAKDAVEGWEHYPVADVFDPDSGSVWYYHCHLPKRDDREHGHFHCFMRPEGKEGPIHHLVAISVDAAGRPFRLFTTNQWVTGDQHITAAEARKLLAHFDVQMDQPSYLVNRWISALLRLYEADIASLLEQHANQLQAWSTTHNLGTEATLKDRQLEVTASCTLDLHTTAIELEKALNPPAA